MYSANHDIRLMTKIARLYYLDGLKQEEISDRVGISRSTVSRLLKLAHELNLLTITVASPPEARFAALEQALEAQFGLREAVVIEAGETREESLTALGRAGAQYLERVIKPGQTVAVSWGSTLKRLADALEPRPMTGVTVVPLLGGSGRTDLQLHANEIAQTVARAFGGEFYPLLAPVLASSASVRNAFIGEEPIRQVLDLAASAQVAAVGIAGVGATATMHQTGYLGAGELQELQAGVCVGDICSHFIDREGRPCAPDLNSRVVGLTLPELQRIPTVIGVAGGLSKADAIRGSMRARWINVLVTDSVTAEAILTRDERGS